MTKITANNQYATHESRELRRIRDSATFRLVLIFSSALTSPKKFLLLPISVARFILSLFRKKSFSLPETVGKKASIVIVGIDRRQNIWADRAQKIATDIHEYDPSLRLALLSTGNVLNEDKAGRFVHYRIPPPRTIDSGRKDWNLTCERLLSSMIYSHSASVILFLGDYLFSGVRHAIEMSPKGTKLICLHIAICMLEKASIHNMYQCSILKL